MHCFVVQGLNLQFHAVQLFPLEKCFCFAKKNCSHIKACKLAIGQKLSDQKSYNLSALRKNLRGRNRSGRKRPRVSETKNLKVEQAPDSKTKHVINSSGNHLSFNSNFESKRMRLTEGVFKSSNDETPPAEYKLAGASSSQPSHLDSAFLGNADAINSPHSSSTISSSVSLPWKNCSKLPIVTNTIEVGPIVIQKADFFTLKPTVWLSDAVIDSFLFISSQFEYLDENYIKILPFGAHFITWLQNKTPATSYFNTWLKQVYPNKYDILIFPINVCNSHWVLTIVFLQSKVVLHLDSLHCVNIAHLNHIWSFVKFQLGNVSEDEWSICAPTDFLKQANNFDCGVYLRLFVFALCSGTEFSYDTAQSEQIRNWIGETLVQNHKKAFPSAQFSAKLMRPRNVTQLHINPTRLAKKRISRTCPPNYCSTSNLLQSICKFLSSRSFSQCAHTICIRPTQDCTMVYCEGKCHEWYHVKCISDSLNSKDLLEKFLCPKCS